MIGNSPGDALGPEVWPTFLADAADIAEEYREAGWEVRECDPGDVTAIESTDHDRFGFSLTARRSPLPQRARGFRRIVGSTSE